ncbi:glycosyltransferase family 2 protein [Alphaproteobacteria bacterium]|nr:glycosyltransferase family 2 protein [Alphaproteobacteria bacterium]
MLRETQGLCLVTVIIPVFNGMKFLEETVKSVQTQTYRNLEILIVDDCSTDDTADLASKLAKKDTRIKFVQLDANCGGPAGPRNVGLLSAQGDFVAFCDADDLWAENKIERQLSVLRSQKVSVVGGGLQNFRGRRPELLESGLREKPELFSRVSFWGTLMNSNLRISSLMIETKLARGIMFDESRHVQAREDYLFVLKATERSVSAIKLNSVLGGYRVHDKQISSNKISMLVKHFRVLFFYQLDNQRRIGFFAFPFTLSHFVLAFWKHVSGKPF